MIENKVKVSQESQGSDGPEGKKFFISLLKKFKNLITKHRGSSYCVSIKWVLLTITICLNIARIILEISKTFLASNS